MGNKLELVKINQNIFLTKLRKRKKPYYIQVNGIKIVVNPDVFPPRTDTRLLTAHIKVNCNDRILDIGTGTGVIAVIAGIQGASGIAIDINPKAIYNARKNFQKFNINMKAIESDMFDRIQV